MKKNRQSNIELLRIISMLMIILSHYTVHNTIINNTLNLGLNRFILEISSLGNLGVVIFIIITGYFNINSDSFKLNKLIKLISQVLFYSLGIYIVFVMLKINTFSITECIKVILPITFNQYWFITVYVALYFITPYINKLLNSFNKKEYIKYLMLGFMLISLLHIFTSKDLYFNQLMEFIFYYSIGAYLKKYSDNIFKYKNINTIVLITSIILLILSVISMDLLGLKISILGEKSIYFFARYSPLIILIAISIFNAFNKINMENNKFINSISSCVFGVYLIHDNKCIRNVLWTKILRVPDYVNSNLLILHIIVSVLLVFIVCIIIEFVRKNTIEKVTDKLIDKTCKYVENAYNKIFYKLCNKLNIE